MGGFACGRRLAAGIPLFVLLLAHVQFSGAVSLTHRGSLNDAKAKSADIAARLAALTASFEGKVTHKSEPIVTPKKQEVAGAGWANPPASWLSIEEHVSDRETADTSAEAADRERLGVLQETATQMGVTLKEEEEETNQLFTDMSKLQADSRDPLEAAAERYDSKIKSGEERKKQLEADLLELQSSSDTQGSVTDAKRTELAALMATLKKATEQREADIAKHEQDAKQLGPITRLSLRISQEFAAIPAGENPDLTSSQFADLDQLAQLAELGEFSDSVSRAAKQLGLAAEAAKAEGGDKKASSFKPLVSELVNLLATEESAMSAAEESSKATYEDIKTVTQPQIEVLENEVGKLGEGYSSDAAKLASTQAQLDSVTEELNLYVKAKNMLQISLGAEHDEDKDILALYELSSTNRKVALDDLSKVSTGLNTLQAETMGAAVSDLTKDLHNALSGAFSGGSTDLSSSLASTLSGTATLLEQRATEHKTSNAITAIKPRFAELSARSNPVVSTASTVNHAAAATATATAAAAAAPTTMADKDAKAADILERLHALGELMNGEA